MVKHITPSLIGLPFNKAHKTTDGHFYGPALGTVVKGEDAHDYILAAASATINPETVSVLTESGFTMAAGSGAWTSPNLTLASGDIAWFRKTAIDAT